MIAFFPRRFRAMLLGMIARRILLICLFGSVWGQLQAGALDYVPVLATSPLSIETADGQRYDFVVEVAANVGDRQRGLMFRETLPPDRGMLFDCRRPQRVSMWMKNTLIPLDMVFIKSDGTVESYRERAVPHSLETISSQDRVRAVLELPSGTVDRLGIAPGDRIVHEIFDGG